MCIRDRAAEEGGDALGPEVDEAGGGAADDVEAAEASACGAHEFKPEQGAAGGAGERSAQVDVCLLYTSYCRLCFCGKAAFLPPVFL